MLVAAPGKQGVGTADMKEVAADSCHDLDCIESSRPDRKTEARCWLRHSEAVSHRQDKS